MECDEFGEIRFITWVAIIVLPTIASALTSLYD